MEKYYAIYCKKRQYSISINHALSRKISQYHSDLPHDYLGRTWLVTWGFNIIQILSKRPVHYKDCKFENSFGAFFRSLKPCATCYMYTVFVLITIAEMDHT